jgi:hypothetical protein
MTELDLFKWIQSGVEYHWHFEECLVMPNTSELEEFFNIASASLFDDDGIIAHIKHGYIVFDLVHVCDYYGIDINNVAPLN